MSVVIVILVVLVVVVVAEVEMCWFCVYLCSFITSRKEIIPLVQLVSLMLTATLSVLPT